jgi:hypothetical protein
LREPVNLLGLCLVFKIWIVTFDRLAGINSPGDAVGSSWRWEDQVEWVQSGFSCTFQLITTFFVCFLITYCRFYSAYRRDITLNYVLNLVGCLLKTSDYLNL